MNEKEKRVYEWTIEMFDAGCALCGNKEFQMHHIRYGGIYGRKTYIGNVIPLCKYHHDLVHTNKRVYMPYLIGVINERIEKNG